MDIFWLESSMEGNSISVDHYLSCPSLAFPPSVFLGLSGLVHMHQLSISMGLEPELSLS